MSGSQLGADLPLASGLATVYVCSASQHQVSAHILARLLNVDDAYRNAARERVFVFVSYLPKLP